MLNIAIVEDESAHAELMERYLDRWAREKHIACRLRKFLSAEGFLFEWEENRTWDAVFLDIQMPGIDGVELAKRIRAEDQKVAIVFATGISDYLQEGYEVAALHYLVKPLDEQKVGVCMERIIEGKVSQGRESAIVTSGERDGERCTLRLLPEDILYIEAFLHYTEVHVKEGVYRTKEGIGVWQKRLSEERLSEGRLSGERRREERLSEARATGERLPAGQQPFGQSMFVVCHRSYLVNLLYVARIENTELVLDSGDRLPLSRRNQRAVNDAFIRFYSRV